jgi:hypothetical protein
MCRYNKGKKDEKPAAGSLPYRYISLSEISANINSQSYER